MRLEKNADLYRTRVTKMNLYGTFGYRYTRNIFVMFRTEVHKHVE